MNIKIDASEIQKLVPMPAAITQLSRVAFNPEVGVQDAARVIEFDQVLTANVLSWANSSWSAARSPILTVKDAVVRFGIENILKLAIGKRIAGSMKKPNPGYELGENELWRHSVAAALVAECLCDFTTTVPRAAFTGALVHDIGKLLLGKYLHPPILQELRDLIEKEQISYIEAEQRMLGTNHALVGAEIARFWNFPENLISVIQRHHEYEFPPDPLLDSVQIANAVTKLLGIGMGSEQMNIDIHSSVPERMGLSDTKIEQLCVAVSEKLAATEALWEI